MGRRAITTLGAVAIAGVLFAMALPRLLRILGLHPEYQGRRFTLGGKRALIVTTSHGVLNAPGENTGRRTGVFASELSVPYYEFLDARMRVDVASVDGGEIPVDPTSFIYAVKTDADDRYLGDPVLQDKVENSLAIADVDISGYDVIFIAGGWGAAYDLGYSETLGRKVSEAYYGPRTPIIGTVCHGPLGLIHAKDLEGRPLIADRRMTGVTNKQVRELGIGVTPQHPETELRKAGAAYESVSAFRDVFANHVVVDEERRFVTGQNQNAGHEVAQRIMKLIAAR